MAISSWSHTLVWVSLAGALAGCSTVPDGQHSAGLTDGSENAVTGAEPVPRFEPPSRSGNPDTYVVFGRRYRVKDTSAGYREQGTASWYGWEFHGRKTSSGPLFNMFELTAAHKSLPLPSYVRVTNLENGRNIVVKVTDRGPFVGTRLIDLSYAAAARLDMLGHGTAPVEVVALAPYQSLPTLALRRAQQRELLASRAERAHMREATHIEFARAAPIRPTAQAQGRPPASVLARLEPAKPPVRLALASGERTPASKPPMRLALAEVERSTPKTAAKAANTKPGPVQDDRHSGRATVQALPAAPTAKGRDAAAKRPVHATSAHQNGKPVPVHQANEPRPMAVRLAGSAKMNRGHGIAD